MEEQTKEVMPTLKDIRTWEERKGFLLTTIERLSVDGHEVVNLPQQPENETRIKKLLDMGGNVLVEVGGDDSPGAINKGQRRILEKKNFTKATEGKLPKKIWRWPAGGTMIILSLADTTVGFTVLRDIGAPSYAGCNTVGAGLGGSEAEILYPLRTALREGIEEIPLKVAGAFLCPEFDSDAFGFGLEVEEIVKDSADILRPYTKEPQEKPRIMVASAEFLSLPGEKNVTVKWRGRKRRCRGVVNFDPENSGVDVLTAFRVELSGIKLKDITAFDGEVLGGQTWLNRQIDAYELTKDLKPTGKIVASWKGGERIASPERIWPNPFVPHTKDVMEALGKIQG